LKKYVRSWKRAAIAAAAAAVVVTVITTFATGAVDAGPSGSSGSSGVTGPSGWEGEPTATELGGWVRVTTHGTTTRCTLVSGYAPQLAEISVSFAQSSDEWHTCRITSAAFTTGFVPSVAGWDPRWSGAPALLGPTEPGSFEVSTAGSGFYFLVTIPPPVAT
jgi:hypothetical protein